MTKRNHYDALYEAALQGASLQGAVVKSAVLPSIYAVVKADQVVASQFSAVSCVVLVRKFMEDGHISGDATFEHRDSLEDGLDLRHVIGARMRPTTRTWARYTSADGTVAIIDVHGQYVGPLECAKGWKYMTAQERASLTSEQQALWTPRDMSDLPTQENPAITPDTLNPSDATESALPALGLEPVRGSHGFAR